VATANVSVRLGNVLFRQQNRTARHADRSGVTGLGLLLLMTASRKDFFLLLLKCTASSTNPTMNSSQ
jgi:hypothetical protein